MFWIVLLIILAIALIALVALYIFGNKLQKKQLSQKEQMAEAAQPVTMLVIDKKVLPMKDANLPKMIMEQTPKRYQKAKVPVVKAKIGSQIMNLICDDAIFEDVPTKGEVKAMVSGIYILSVKSLRNKKTNEVEDTKKEKKGLRGRLRKQQVKYQKQLNEQLSSSKSKKTETSKTKQDLKKEKARARKIKNL